MSASTRGACLCGAVTFTIAPPYRWFAHCHCSMCRKHHGSLFGTTLGVAREQIRWLGGDDAVVHYRASQSFERPFCRHCGSSVPAVSHDDGIYSVPAGLLAGDPGARPRSHIFVASRSPLHVPDDTLLEHAAYPPGIDLPTVATRPALDASAAVCGSCLCGAVVFTAAAMPRRVLNCYCSLCRRSRAAAFGSTLLVAREGFRWRSGAGGVRSYALPSPRRYGTDFCADCGSPVPSAASSPWVMLPAGAIDSPLPPLPAVHLYVGSKAPWYEITDSGPQFQELPPPEQLTALFQ